MVGAMDPRRAKWDFPRGKICGSHHIVPFLFLDNSHWGFWFFPFGSGGLRISNPYASIEYKTRFIWRVSGGGWCKIFRNSKTVLLLLRSSSKAERTCSHTSSSFHEELQGSTMVNSFPENGTMDADVSALWPAMGSKTWTIAPCLSGTSLRGPCMPLVKRCVYPGNWRLSNRCLDLYFRPIAFSFTISERFQSS